jgi:hypothetical protein
MAGDRNRHRLGRQPDSSVARRGFARRGRGANRSLAQKLIQKKVSARSMVWYKLSSIGFIAHEDTFNLS